MKHRDDDKKETFKILPLITQMGLVMIASVGMTTALGIWLDRRLGTSYITVILFFVGAVAGCQGVYRLVKKICRDEDGKDDTVSKKGR
ncbi:MAG: AtpZ/AtpI family protein [Acetatifactor sp.]|nr:AtpZ/AtpI family protein [Acetatifactor sp.]MDE6642244.1 AtpZ/AtpI family protein [Acetatifactor sp.]